MTVTAATAVAGVIAGLGIGGLAVGLVLVYRASRVINLAQAELGAAAAALCAWLVRQGHLPFAVAAVVAVGSAAVAGALIEMLVVRRIASGSAAAVVIATAGVGEVLLAVALVVITAIGDRGGYPVPFRATVDLGRGVILHGADVALLVVISAAGLALAAVLRMTRLGAAARAASDNPAAARMAGVPVSLVSAGAWAAAAALAAVVVICLLAGRPIVGTESLGPEVLFESLAAAVVARFWNLPVALAAGVGIGVIEQVVAYNWPGGARVVVLFAVTAGAALVLRPGRGRRNEPEAAGDWLLVPVLPGRPRGGGWGHALAGPAALAAVALAVVRWASNSQALTFTTIAAYALLAISATLIVGVAGQLSLGQVGFFGVGAAVSYQLAAVVGAPFWLAFLGAGLTAAVVSALVGVPALRGQGPLFAVTSLGFALVAAGWLLSQPWLLGSGAYIPRPILGPIDLAGQRAYFVFAVVIPGGGGGDGPGLVAAVAGAARGGGPGQRGGGDVVRGDPGGDQAGSVRPGRVPGGDRRRGVWPWPPVGVGERFPGGVARPADWGPRQCADRRHCRDRGLGLGLGGGGRGRRHRGRRRAHDQRRAAARHHRGGAAAGPARPSRRAGRARVVGADTCGADRAGVGVTPALGVGRSSRAGVRVMPALRAGRIGRVSG